MEPIQWEKPRKFNNPEAFRHDFDNSAERQIEINLLEIESADEYWGPVFKAIYDGDEHTKFMERLDSRIKTHDKDIERMCNFHYQGFIDSIRELLRVRNQVTNLKEEVTSIHDEFQKSILSIHQSNEDLIKARRLQKNICAAIQALAETQPALVTYTKVQQLVKEQRYYPALKTLNHLEHVELPKIPNYRFCQQMRESFSKLREHIKGASMAELKDFLEIIRKVSPKIGDTAMRQVTQQRESSDPQIENEVPSDVGNNNEEEISVQDFVNFSPVYRCLHIYSVLGAKDSFVSYYRKQRQQQSRLTLQPHSNMHETLEGYRKYFSGVVGFFVVEDHVLNTAGDLVDRNYLEEVWEHAVTQMSSSLRLQTRYCTDPAILIEVKGLILLLSVTLGNYGYPVQQLTSLILDIRDHYNEVLMQSCHSVFENIFDEDDYQPIITETDEEYQQVINTFPYKNEDLDSLPCPKCFPFSQFVPKVYCEVLAFIEPCIQFSQDLNLSATECEDMVRKSTNLLLTKTLSNCLTGLIKRPGLSIPQLVQISINVNHLEFVNEALEAYISNLTSNSNEHNDSFHVVKIQSRAMFKDARDEAEQQIYECLKNKVSEFVEISNYDWMLSEPTGYCSPYVTELLGFLTSTFESFSSLPDRVSQTACMCACQEIAKGLMRLILDFEVKQISMGALQQLNLDVIQYEQFAASDPVPGFDEGSLQMCFMDIRQLLDIFMTWDWSAYFHDYGQITSKYHRVNPSHCILLLEKIREADKGNMFAALKKSERDKKKLLETVLKQLRQLTAST